MHGKLFAQPAEWDTTPDQARTSFERYAGVLDIDPAALLQCLDQERFRDEVQADVDEAAYLGLNGTPSFIINGKLLVGAYPTEEFVQLLEGELAEVQ